MTSQSSVTEPNGSIGRDKPPAGYGRMSWMVAGGLVAALAGAFWLHRRIAVVDQQRANLTFGAILMTVGLITMVLIWRVARRAGRGRSAIAAMIAAALLAVMLLRFEGFDGEMAPQFAWRFGGAPPRQVEFADASGDAEMATRTAEPSAENADGESVDPAVDLISRRNVSLGFQELITPVDANAKSFATPNSPEEVGELWRIGVGQGWSSFAVDGELAITLEQRGDQECVTAYDLQTGDPVWIHRSPGRHENVLGGIGPRSTPVIAADSGQIRVFAAGATGKVWCLDIRDGSPIWQADLLAMVGWSQEDSEAVLPWGRSASPLVIPSGDRNFVVVPLGGPDSIAGDGRSLVAFDAADGSVVWRAGDLQVSFASAVAMTFDGVDQIVAVNEDYVTGHDIATGDTLWSFDWPGRSNTGPSCASAVAVGDDGILVGKGYGGGSTLARVTHRDDGSWSAEEEWHSNRLLQTKFNHTVVRDNVGYGVGNGSIEAVDLTVPKRLWRGKRRDRIGQGHLVLAGDTLIAQAETGEVRFVAADPAEYRELCVLDALSSKTWNIPTLAGKYLLVRNDREAICFELPLSKSFSERRTSAEPDRVVSAATR